MKDRVLFSSGDCRLLLQCSVCAGVHGSDLLRPRLQSRNVALFNSVLKA